jgi:predicted DNA-binding ribbon-helix-helix protein
MIVKRSIFFAGHRTSVSLEDAFWKGLKENAGARRMSLSQLVASIGAKRRGNNLSSAIRLLVLNFYRQKNSPAVPISSGATAAEKNMKRIGHGQTVEALLAYLAGHRGRIVSYRAVGPSPWLQKDGPERETLIAPAHLSHEKASGEAQSSICHRRCF